MQPAVSGGYPQEDTWCASIPTIPWYINGSKQTLAHHISFLSIHEHQFLRGCGK